MSFLSRIKDLGKSQDEDEVQPEALASEGPVTASGEQTIDPRGAVSSTLQPGGGSVSDSIISEAAPSEFPPDYHDNRLKAEAEGRLPSETSTGLPVIGTWSLARQQRLLFISFILGALGLMASAFWSVNSADKRAAQAGATGQALMQSQRLAKSVSQALVGRGQAFQEVAESAKVLASNVRGLAQ
ncbi:MAG: type IV pili methyl-accepting chemotaxis transducer N-terminal domain-containing protein, partial [Pseudomonadota bacterium]